MDSEEYMRYLDGSREDATAIGNAAMSFMMSRAEMIQCSPVMCLLVLRILCERNLEGHIKMSAESACKMSRRNLDPARVRHEMREVVKEAHAILDKGFKSKLVDLNDV